MTRFCWWLADIVSRLLEPDEREAVFGDLAESGETAGQALWGVLGLVGRRQARLWSGWQPWLMLVGAIVPLGMLLSIVSRTTADGSAIYIWMYANNWDWALTKNPGFWRVMAETAGSLFLWYLTLVCWSWTCGFVVGSVSRSMIRINGVLLYLVLLFGEAFGAPHYFAYVQQYMHRAFSVPALPDSNAAVFDVTFYREMLPLIVQVVLVAVPAIWGLSWGLSASKLPPWSRAILWTAAIATLAGMVLREPGFWILLGPPIVHAYLRPGIWLGKGLHVLQFVVYWPIAYLCASAIRRRWPRTAPV